MGSGHEMQGEDLMDEYLLECEELVFRLRKKMQDEFEQAGEKKSNVAVLGSEECALLQAAENTLKQASLAKSNRNYYKQMLMLYCDVTDRKPDLVFPMTREESKLVCQLSWQAFDRIFHILSYGGEEELAAFVCNVDEFVKVSRLSFENCIESSRVAGIADFLFCFY